MKRELARYLLLLVNDKEMLDRLQALIDSKIENHRLSLESAKTIERVSELQGAIAELRRLKFVQDEVRAAAE
jgi:hypothetical protein